MFKKRSAVEPCQPVSVTRKVRRNPVHNYADAVIVARINKIFKFRRVSVSAVDRIIPRHLIAPASVKRILAYRHKLNVRITHFFYIRNKLVFHFGIGIVRTVLFCFPRTEMHFINVYRLVIRRGFRAVLKPFAVLPVIRQISKNRSGRRSYLGIKRIRVGL